MMAQRMGWSGWGWRPRKQGVSHISLKGHCTVYFRSMLLICVIPQFNKLDNQWNLFSQYELSAVTLFNLYTEHIMRHAGLDELQAIIKIGGRNNNLRYANDI